VDRVSGRAEVRPGNILRQTSTTLYEHKTTTTVEKEKRQVKVLNTLPSIWYLELMYCVVHRKEARTQNLRTKNKNNIKEAAHDMIMTESQLQFVNNG